MAASRSRKFYTVAEVLEEVVQNDGNNGKKEKEQKETRAEELMRNSFFKASDIFVDEARQGAFHVLHAGDLRRGPAKTLGVSAQECKVISTWRNGAIGAFQFGMIFTNSKIIRVTRESLYYLIKIQFL